MKREVKVGRSVHRHSQTEMSQGVTPEFCGLHCKVLIRRLAPRKASSLAPVPLVKRLREADHLLAPADVERLAALAAARLWPAFVAPRTPAD
jgi:hypothetical protein